MEQKFWTINVITKGIGLYEITDNIIATVSEVGCKWDAYLVLQFID